MLESKLMIWRSPEHLKDIPLLENISITITPRNLHNAHIFATVRNNRLENNRHH